MFTMYKALLEEQMELVLSSIVLFIHNIMASTYNYITKSLQYH